MLASSLLIRCTKSVPNTHRKSVCHHFWTRAFSPTLFLLPTCLSPANHCQFTATHSQNMLIFNSITIYWFAFLFRFNFFFFRKILSFIFLLWRHLIKTSVDLGWHWLLLLFRSSSFFFSSPFISSKTRKQKQIDLISINFSIVLTEINFSFSLFTSGRKTPTDLMITKIIQPNQLPNTFFGKKPNLKQTHLISSFFFANFAPKITFQVENDANYENIVQDFVITPLCHSESTRGASYTRDLALPSEKGSDEM